ncbi:hypothetical protein T07_4118 [Trichinella nelsoni]|uniref:Uncharacterized protein n=1 Tax=Trichinella nelsoni TaxID=6336 RepID=A0A0V0RH80_9BILA|nr:hypothetical protein T07_4118 [Trichinella nelsoni]
MSSWCQHLDEAPFCQYFPLKPGQCSIKIFWYCDTKIPYSQASEFNVEQVLWERYVKLEKICYLEWQYPGVTKLERQCFALINRQPPPIDTTENKAKQS